jgi:hypothetical protein
MGYSRATLKADLQALKMSSWDWPGDKPGSIRPDLLKSNPALRTAKDPGQALLEEMTEYCWKAYQKALATAGDLVIGRVPDLTAAGLYEKVADLVAGATIFDDGTSGNLLKMDKWARVVNDSWILGGVHRQAKFRLASGRVPKNLWDSANNRLVVTARELLGLLHFGYELQQVGPWQVLICRNGVRAATADLLKYHLLIGRHGSSEQATKMLEQARTGEVAPEVMGLKLPARTSAS